MWQRIRSAPGARHAAAVLATAGIVATFVPTRRATQIEPVSALRHE